MPTRMLWKSSEAAKYSGSLAVAAALMTLTASAVAPTLHWQQLFAPTHPGAIDSGWRITPLPGGDVAVATSTLDDRHSDDMLVYRLSESTGQKLWERRFGSGGSAAEPAEAIASDPQGYVAVGGAIFSNNSWDFLTARLSPVDGSTIWEKRYNGPENSTDGARAIACASNGDVIVSGYSWTGSSYDIHTIRYAAANGAILWERTYGGAANGEDLPISVAIDPFGNVILSAHVTVTGAGLDFYTAKLNGSTGAVLWESLWGGSANRNDAPRALAVDASGNAVVTGTSLNETNDDALTLKLSAADGSLVWSRRYNGPANLTDGPRGLAIGADGEVFVGLSTQNAQNYDMVAIRYAAATGLTVWENLYNGASNGNDLSRWLVLNGDGNPVLTGNSHNGTNFDVYTACHDASTGTRLWMNLYNGPGGLDDVPWSMTTNALGRPVAVGRSAIGTSFDALTLSYANTDGAVRWAHLLDGPTNSTDTPQEVVVAQNGDVIVTAISGNGANNDLVTERRAALTGQLLWRVRYNSPENAPESVGHVAVDALGDVYVACTTELSYLNADTYVAKYAAMTGALLWERRINTTFRTPSWDSAVDISLDPEGELVVVGACAGADSYDDVHLTRLSSSSGSTLWETTFDSGSTWGDGAPEALAVDWSGAIAVAASVQTPSGTRDIVTLLFEGGSGALRWQRTYASPAGHGDFPADLAFDGSGDLFMAGNSTAGNGLTGFTELDIHVVKYGAIDGTPLWQRVYTPAVNRFERADFIEVEPFGDVIVGGLSAASYSGANALGNMLVLRMSGTNGTTVWSRSVSSSDTRGVSSMVIDVGGRVAVAGTTYFPGQPVTGLDVVKLDDNGTTLWSYWDLWGQSPRYETPLLARTIGGNLALFAKSTTGTLIDGTIALLVENPFAEIAADATAVTVAEGSPAQMTGTFSHPSGNLAVNLSASIGNVVEDDITGTWLWTHTPMEGASATTVTIYAFDGGNPPITLTFTLNVTNVLPTFEAGTAANLPASALGQFQRGPISFSDPGADVWTGTVSYGDGTPDAPLAIDAPARTFSLAHTYTASGTYTVTVRLRDEAGTDVIDSFQLTAEVTPVPVFHAIGDLPGGSILSEVRDATRVNGVILAVGGSSALPGSTVTDAPVLWSSVDGLRALPHASPNNTAPVPTFASAITPDGRYIASRTRINPTGGTRKAARVDAATLAPLVLTEPVGSSGNSAALGISDDGSVLYGFGQNNTLATRYTSGGVPGQLIPLLNPAVHTTNIAAGRAVSADGSVMVGSSSISGSVGPGMRGFRYVHGSGVSALPMLPGGTWNTALAVTPDGHVSLLAGDRALYPQGSVYLHDARTDALTELGSPNGSIGPNILAGMSADASVVVGVPSGDYVRNAQGWHTLKQILSSAGIAMSGWDNFTVVGISRDARLVYGSGLHNDAREGFVIDFPAGFLANYSQPDAPSAPDAAIVGAWTGGSSANDQVLVCFLPTGWYVQYELGTPAFAPTGITGMERGRFTWSAATKVLTATSLLDQNGILGLSGNTFASGVATPAFEDRLQLVPVGGSAAFLTPVSSPVPLVGVWLRDGSNPAQGTYELLAFLENGTYVHLREGAANGGGFSGGEHGSYAWNVLSGTVSTTATADSNGTWGLNTGVSPAVISEGMLNGTFTKLGRGVVDFTDWSLMHFTPAELANPLQSGPDADFNNDGVSNLMHYALGRAPTQALGDHAGVIGRIATVTPPGSNDTLTLTFTRPEPARPDLTYRVLESSNLTTWTSLDLGVYTVTTMPNLDGTLSVMVRSSTPLPNSGGRFMRLEVVP